MLSGRPGENADRLLRDFVSLENVNKHEADVENVEHITYNPAAGESPDQLIPKTILRQPDVMICSEPPNGETVRLLCEFARDEDKLTMISVRAREAVEALLRS